ncbi:MAG TPA: EF-hand domain-containing protein [Opitutaceae bacterium]|nr:EF-hand domain-containing protein [Opitutaceae bacterium]
MLFLVGSLRAADAPAAPAPPAPAVVTRAAETPLVRRRLTPEEVLRLFDRNHDGKLDDDERAAAHDALVRQQVERQVEKAEVRKAEPPPARPARRVEGATTAPRRAAVAKKGPAAMREKILERFDRNGDGRIDDREWAVLEPIFRRRIENAPRQLARYDRNGDGKLDDEEWAAAAIRIRQWLNPPALGSAAEAR